MEIYKESIIKMLSKILSENIIFEKSVPLDISGRRILISSASIFPVLSIKCFDGEVLELKNLNPEDIIKISKLLCHHLG